MAQPTNSVDGTGMRRGYRDSDDVEANGAELQRVDTLTIDPALYEKLFLNPQTPVKGSLRQMFAVPTPIALIGFGLALSPLSCELMGWRGSDQQAMGVANIGAFYWFGGLLTILAGLLEFFLGNTFSFVIFMGYRG